MNGVYVEDVEEQLEEQLVVESVHVAVVLLRQHDDDGCQDLLEQVGPAFRARGHHGSHQDGHHLADLIDVGVVELDDAAGRVVDPAVRGFYLSACLQLTSMM